MSLLSSSAQSVDGLPVTVTRSVPKKACTVQFIPWPLKGSKKWLRGRVSAQEKPSSKREPSEINCLIVLRFGSCEFRKVSVAFNPKLCSNCGSFGNREASNDAAESFW